MRSAFFYKDKEDARLRIKLFLCLSFLFNVGYSIFLSAIYVINASKWVFVMSIYYGLLAVARLFVLAQIELESQLRLKIKTFRVCGYFLLLINVTVSVMMFLMSRGEENVAYYEIAVIAIAAYTFSALTVAIVSSVKYLKRNDYVYSSVKLISLIAASVSLVTLTNTMLATFGADNLLLRKIIMPILSGAVAIFIVATAILMIRKAHLDLKELKDGKERE